MAHLQTVQFPTVHLQPTQLVGGSDDRLPGFINETQLQLRVEKEYFIQTRTKKNKIHQ